MAVPHPTSDPSAAQPTAKGLLSLPEDLFSEIIHYLPVREVIYLSLTCRGLFHGALSPYNSYLWYRVGAFRENGPPGYSEKWYFPQNSMLPVVTTQEPGTAVTTRSCCVYPWPKTYPAPPQIPALPSLRDSGPGFPTVGTNRKTFRMEEGSLEVPKGTSRNGMRLSDFQESVKFAKPLPFTTDQGEEIFIFPDYRRLLSDTMLGLTERGCQWCLQLTPSGSEARFCPQLDMRLCDWCYGPNVLSWNSVVNLEQKLPIETNRILNKQKSPPEAHVYGSNPVYVKALNRREYPRFSGVWKPLAARVLRTQFGEQVASEDFVETEFKTVYILSLEQLPTQMPDQMVVCLRDAEDMDF